MSVPFSQYFQTKETSQSQAIPGTDQVENSSGGFVWAVNDWTRLDRFLILGTEGGSYYASEQELTIKNAEAVVRCIKADGERVVKRIVEISEAGRAPKNDPAIFALVMAAGMGDAKTKAAAFNALSKVARFSTPFFMFLEHIQGFKGWGRGLSRAVCKWFNEKDVKQLAYQFVKYRQRNGWSHRDLLRLAHPKPATPAHNALFRWVVASESMGEREVSRRERKDGPMVVKKYEAIDRSLLPPIISAFEAVQQAKDAEEVVRLIGANPNLSWEMIPTEFLGEKKIWRALLLDLLPTALIRNLGRMTANGLLSPLSDAVRIAVERLSDGESIREARVHPVAVLAALTTYSEGHGARGDLSWDPVGQIADALDNTFHLAFGNITPTGKRFMLCLDLSRSMAGSEIAGIPGLTPRRGAAAMSLITAATEPNHIITGFTAVGSDTVRFPGRSRENLELAVSVLPISPKQRLDDVVRLIESYGQGRVNGKYGFGGTDCSLPMRYALDREIPVDTFVVYTDSETWAGDIHPAQALREYRRKTGIPAKLVVVGMVANGFSIADPDDSGMFDVVGFDTATPELISDFAMR
ncbi:MAG: TROVE domain-containing protein [bacterium]|nr:TROVE domain-containing protein [bacterium]